MSAAPKSITIFKGDTSGVKNKVNVLEKIQPAHFEQEVEKIYRHVWLPVEATAELPQRGSYVAVDVPPLKASLLVMRGQDDTVRAFYNICRHRANKLVPDNTQGCKLAFSCRFHGWTYSADGRCVGVTDESQFVGLDKASYGLIPVHCEVAEGLVFVNFADKPRETLREWLGDIHGGYLDHFEGRQQIASWSIVVNANWHITVNAFTEGYHSLFLHRATLPDYQGGKGNPMRHRPFLEVMRRHGRYSAKSNPDHKMTPVEAISYNAGRKLYPAFPEVDCSVPDFPKAVNPGRVDNWAFDITEFFPCFVLIDGAEWHQCMWFWPVDADHTLIRVVDYAYKAQTVGDRLAHSYMRVRNREVFREDISTMEAIHASLKSGAMPEIILSQQEMLIQKHYAMVEQMVGSHEHAEAAAGIR
jgi:phenylpropionate dioxygenase-like ring-hydroxylating dioxygenase large terminal subunit